MTTKEVEWVGGPFDGRVDAMPEQAEVIRVVLPVLPELWGDVPRDSSLDLQYDLPIQRRPDGRFYVVFRYPDWIA